MTGGRDASFDLRLDRSLPQGSGPGRFLEHPGKYEARNTGHLYVSFLDNMVAL